MTTKSLTAESSATELNLTNQTTSQSSSTEIMPTESKISEATISESATTKKAAVTSSTSDETKYEEATTATGYKYTFIICADITPLPSVTDGGLFHSCCTHGVLA